MCNFIASSALADTKVSRAILNFQVIYRIECFHLHIFCTSKNGKYYIIQRKLCLIMFYWWYSGSFPCWQDPQNIFWNVRNVFRDFRHFRRFLFKNEEESKHTIKTVVSIQKPNLDQDQVATKKTLNAVFGDFN